MSDVLVQKVTLFLIGLVGDAGVLDMRWNNDRGGDRSGETMRNFKKYWDTLLGI